MNKSSKVILLSFAAVIGILFIKVSYKSLYDELFLSQECWDKINTKNLQFSGLVSRKFIDSDNHNTKAVAIIEDNNTTLVHFAYNEEYELWEKIKINDSIKKSSNTLIFYIRDSLKWNSVSVKFNCNK